MGIGIVNGMDCSKIGFNVYQQAGQWMIDIIGQAGAVPVRKGGPPYTKVRVDIAYTGTIWITNTNNMGAFLRRGEVLKQFKQPFFIDVWYQDPVTLALVGPCRIELPISAGVNTRTGTGVSGAMDCSKISFTVYQQAGKDMIRIYGKEGAVPVKKGPPPYTQVKVDIAYNPTIWITNTDHMGAFWYEGELKQFIQPFFIDVWYRDPTTLNLGGPCTIRW